MRTKWLAVLVLVACSREERTQAAPTSSVTTTVTSATSTTSATPLKADASAGAKRCLPVVAAECGCTYSCGTGTEVSPGKWSVAHPFWAPSLLDAKIAPWCVAGDCTDAFHGQIVCSAVCSPKPADHTCHFEGDRCVSGQKP